MSYQLTEILQRCDKDDCAFFINSIDSYLNFTDDKGLREMDSMWDGKNIMPIPLANKIETEIRYLGSNDVAYAYRKAKGEIPPGVELDEMIDDACNVMKFKVNSTSSIETRLELFCRRMVDKSFFSFDQKKQIEILENSDISRTDIDKILKQTKAKTEMFIPVLLGIVGNKSAIKIAKTVITLTIGKFIGPRAAQAIFTILMSKMPWLSALGPIYLTLLTGWTIIDFAGPSTRKTIPLLLYLGLLCLRNDEDKEFWSEE